MLQRSTEWSDLGVDYFDRIDREKAAARHVRRLKELGYDVELKAAA